jgi:parallel beta-helix repeat protein
MFIMILADILVVVHSSRPIMAGLGVIRVPEDYPTIKKAVNASTPGDTIIVSEGTYAEGEIWITKSNLTLTANGTVVVDELRKGWVFYVIADNVTIRGFTVKRSAVGWHYAGISLDHAKGCTIENNTVKNSGDGIFLFASSNNTVVDNNASFNNNFGVFLEYSDSNMIINNTATHNNDGIELWSSNKNFLAMNLASNNNHSGIVTMDAVGTTLVGNVATYNRLSGISLDSSRNSTLRNNNMSDNKYNFAIEGGPLPSFINDIDTSNLVNGKHIVYLVNKHNLTVDPTTFPNAGFVGIVNSTGITVKNVMISNNSYGVLFGYVTNSTIENVTVTNCGIRGIEIFNSVSVIVTESVVTNCWEGIEVTVSNSTTLRRNLLTQNAYGIYLDTDDAYVSFNMAINNTHGGILVGGNNNILFGNTVANTTRSEVLTGGIVLQGGGNNLIVGNMITTNPNGIWVWFAEGNVIYHNNFIKNRHHVSEYPQISANTWDNGYPSGGNYWDDYNGTDFYSGFYQNETESDGIGDTRYTTDAGHVDRYPLMRRWTPLLGDVNWDGVVDIYDIVTASASYGSKIGDLNWNPFADLAPRWGIIDIYDLVTVAANYGKITALLP